MTTGKKYVLFFDRKKGEKIDDAVIRYNKEIKSVKQGNKFIQRARKSDTFEGKVEIIFEGPYVDQKKSKGNLIPIYFEYYEFFDPDLAFLKLEDFLGYGRNFEKINEKYKKSRKEHKFLYDYYLSYEAIIRNLKLNNFITKSNQKENVIRGHYNFLSKFVHSSKESISIITNNGKINFHSPQSNFDIDLLIQLYRGFLVCGFIEYLVKVLSNSPKQFIKSIDCTIMDKVKLFYDKYSYFWFVNNKPNIYDKFSYFTSGSCRKKVKHFSDIKDKDIPFNTRILNRLQDLQKPWSIPALGQIYKPPFNLK